jgi:hypothetical protein
VSHPGAWLCQHAPVNIALTQGGSLLSDAHSTLKADFVIGATQVAEDSRWKWGVPPDGKAALEAQGFTLSPGRYVGALEAEDDEVVFEERMTELVETLETEMAENEQLAGEVKRALARAG